MAITIANRPATLSGAWASWTEARRSGVIRTEMESGAVKIRRRFTGRYRMAQVSVVLKADQYDDFVDWFEVNCLGGLNPTRVMTPRCVEQVWRFAEPPEIDWIDPGFFRVSATLERNESWP